MDTKYYYYSHVQLIRTLFWWFKIFSRDDKLLIGFQCVFNGQQPCKHTHQIEYNACFREILEDFQWAARRYREGGIKRREQKGREKGREKERHRNRETETEREREK